MKRILAALIMLLVFTAPMLSLAQGADFQQHKDPILAGALSWYVPGLGQFYAGSIIKGATFMVLEFGLLYGTIISVAEIELGVSGNISLGLKIRSKDEEVSLLQIWVIPDKRDVDPRYDQFAYDKSKTLNNLYQVISPEKHDQGSWIHQQTWFSLGELDEERVLRYSLKKQGNGIYLFIIEGKIETCDVILEKRDAIGITESEEIEIKSLDKSKILLIEVPIT